MDIVEHPLSLIRIEQAPPGGIANHFLGVFDREIADAGAGPDQADQGIRHRTPKYVSDAGETLQQGRHLGAAKF
jgi:hypothetical protein